MAIRPAEQFVILCVQETDTVDLPALRAAGERVFDWSTVLEVAGRHGVAAFIRPAARRAGVVLPDSIRERLQAAAVSAFVRSLQLRGDLKRIAAVLADANRPIIALKGPVLAGTLYANPAFRPFTDIDLVVQAGDEAAVAGLLGDLGYVEHSSASLDWWRAHGQHVHAGAPLHRTFAGSRQRLVELHADPLQLGLRPACEAARWGRAVPVPDLPGASMLGAEDQLVQLSVHLHKHGFSRLIWLKDLDLLVRASPAGFDWDIVESVARAEGVATSVWHSLRLAVRVLHAPVPSETLARFRPPVWEQVLHGLVWPTARSSGLQGIMRRRAVGFDAAESWRGMLPALVLMGRRRDRARAVVQALRAWRP